MDHEHLHFAIYEFSLLQSGGVPVADACRGILAAHAAEPDVVALFKDLHAEWEAGMLDPLNRMVRPFKNRVDASSDFAIAAYFAEMGALTASAAELWGEMAVAFLLKKKLAVANTPTADDIALGQFLLRWDTKRSIEKEFFSWSAAPAWRAISKRTRTTFPEHWWSVFPPVPADSMRMPTLPVLQREAELSGSADPAIEKINAAWQRYVSAYKSL